MRVARKRKTNTDIKTILLFGESSFHILWNLLRDDYLLVSASFPVKYKLTIDSDRQRQPKKWKCLLLEPKFYQREDKLQKSKLVKRMKNGHEASVKKKKLTPNEKQKLRRKSSDRSQELMDDNVQTTILLLEEYLSILS